VETDPAPEVAASRAERGPVISAAVRPEASSWWIISGLIAMALKVPAAAAFSKEVKPQRPEAAGPEDQLACHWNVVATPACRRAGSQSVITSCRAPGTPRARYVLISSATCGRSLATERAVTRRE
jgi:hypothetical protein